MAPRQVVPLTITRVGCELEFGDVLKSKNRANVVVHTSNPIIQEPETGRLPIGPRPGKNI